MSLRVMLVDDEPERCELVQAALVGAGFELVSILQSNAGLLQEVTRVSPDVIVIDLGSPDRDVLESMQQLSRDNPRPVVMFAEESNAQSTREAIEAGVSAYVVDGLQPSRVQSLVELAVARFNQFSALKQELQAAKSTLAERKQIDRAKGILMDRSRCSESKAYHALRKLAMDRNKTVAEIAESVIATAELLK
ncbi:MAG: ANTAR domain-containing protein [Gammaproteobacteria bacterium]|nr:ANTAR domain-containing protein [Gammaproteobacteria bacterium]